MIRLSINVKLLLMSVLIVLTGCVTGTFHSVHNPALSLHGEAISIMPLNIRISELESYSSSPTLNAEKSERISVKIDKELKAQLSALPIIADFVEPRYVGDIEDPIVRLSIRRHEQIGLEIFKVFAINSTTSLASFSVDSATISGLKMAQRLGGATQATKVPRYALLITVSESFSSPKRKRQMIAKNLTINPWSGESIDHGIENGGLSIIDLHEKKVVWNVTRGKIWDLENPDDLAEFVKNMLEDFPLANAKAN